MGSVYGLTVLSYDEKKLMILTSYFADAIQAINYQTGEIEWKIVTERIDGKGIGPNDVCHDDVGHLFVTDRSNNRVPCCIFGRQN